MESVQLPYELLAEIFKFYVALPDTLPETLLHVCRSWGAIASHESILWTEFVISGAMIRYNDSGDCALTLDWVGIFKRRLARAGPSHPFRVFIFGLHKLLLPGIDVVLGGAPDYIHLPRWETLNLVRGDLIRQDTWSSIVDLVSQPTPSLKCLTLQRNKIDFHAFPDAPNLEELNVLFSRSPLIGQENSFPNLKKIHITYPSKYPLSRVRLDNFSLHTLETLIIGGEVEIGESVTGEYPSLSTLKLTERVPFGIVHISAPSLRHLIFCNADLFPLSYPYPDSDNPQPRNRQVLNMLAGRFPTVEVLEVHRNLRKHVLEMVFGGEAFFTGLKELWATSKRSRKRILVDLVHQ